MDQPGRVTRFSHLAKWLSVTGCGWPGLPVRLGLWLSMLAGVQDRPDLRSGPYPRQLLRSRQPVDRGLWSILAGQRGGAAAGRGTAAAIVIVCGKGPGRGGRGGNRRGAEGVAGRLRGGGGSGDGVLSAPGDAADVRGDDRGDAGGGVERIRCRTPGRGPRP